MLSFVRLQPGKRWPALLLAGTVVSGATVGGLRLQTLLRRELPGLLRARLEAAVGRPVRVGELHGLPTGLWLDSFRVTARPGEAQDPLVARRVGISVSWWDLLFSSRVRVAGVNLQGATLRFVN